MKELSIEEKAARYDRSLERARDVHTYYCDDREQLRKIEHIFPELAESEDERIRKALIEGFKVMNAGSYGECTFSNYNIPVTAIIAWLEKQGEQNPMKTCTEYYNQDNELKMPELSEFQDKLADILMYREYDGPDETEDDIAKGRLEYELAAIRLSEELLPLAQKEQKPAWSEEDEELLNTIINHFKVNVECTDDDDIIKWLKSLKDRVQPQPKQEWKQENTEELSDFENVMMHIGNSFFGQHAGLDPNDTDAIKKQANLLLELVPKQEWSEEDIEILETCISLMSYNDSAKEETDWLKSLRERYTWKPSDEQMDALCYVTNFDYGGYKATLVSLYEQLKKLKG